MTAKVRYPGDGAWTIPRQFSGSLKAKLRTFFPDQDATATLPFGHPADDFVNQLLGEATWALDQLDDDKFKSCKEELRAVHADLVKSLGDVQKKLRNLPPDFDRLLGNNADPLGCADHISELLEHVASAKPKIGYFKRPKTRDRQHHIAIEMSIRVLRVLSNHGIQASASATYDRASAAVQILKAIGDDMGLTLAHTTWRDIVIKAKTRAPIKKK